MNGSVTQNLNYADKYLVQVLGRRDGSSLFGALNRWNNFYQLVRCVENYAGCPHPGFPGAQDPCRHAERRGSGLASTISMRLTHWQSGQLSKNTVGNKELKPLFKPRTRLESTPASSIGST
jgi:hypothetical protein